MNTKRLFLLGMATLTLIFAAGAAAQDYTVSDKVEYAVGRSAEIDLTNISGKLEVIGWDRNSVLVEYTKIAKGSQARRKAELVEVRIAHRRNKVEIEVEYPNKREREDAGMGQNFSVSVDLKLYVPRECETDINNVSGSVTVDGFGGDVKVSVISGRLTARNLTGDIELETVSGGIRLTNAQGGIEAKTVSGSITLEDIKGEVDMETTSGKLTLEASELDSVDMKTMSGGIVMIVDNPINSGDFHLHSFSGSISITLPAGSAFDLNARASHRIDSDFALTEIKSRHRGKIVRGIVNGGGAHVGAKTHSGSIRIRKR